MKFVWLIIGLFFLTTCALEPEKEVVFRDRIIIGETVLGDVPLQYWGAERAEGYSIWKQEEGILLWIIVQNLSDSAWYGYPEIRMYETDEMMDIDDSLTDYDLVSKERGVLTTGFDYNRVPKEIVAFIPGHGYRHALAFIKFDFNNSTAYTYVLWRFVADE